MLLALSLAVLGQRFQVFDSTVSPSKRWAVAYRDPRKGEPQTVAFDEPTVDELVDMKAKRVVAQLKGFHGFPHENHGGMYARYTRNEDLAVVDRAGKWEPRGLLLISTGTGVQLDVLKKVQADADAYFKGHHSLGTGGTYAYDVPGAIFSGSLIHFCVLGQIPKAEDAPVVYLDLAYAYRVTRSGIHLEKRAFTPLKDFPKWTW